MNSGSFVFSSTPLPSASALMPMVSSQIHAGRGVGDSLRSSSCFTQPRAGQ